MSALGRSIFYKVATKEDDYTQPLCNLMQRPGAKGFRSAVLSKILGDPVLASQIGPDQICTQMGVPGAGRPDLVIDAPTVRALVEVKLDPHRHCTENQLPPDGETIEGYCGFLKTASAARKILSFLVPGDWKYPQDTCDRINDLRQCEDSIEIPRPVLWEEIFSLSKQFSTDPLHLEFWRLLGSDFSPIEFTQEEVNVLINGVGLPVRAVIKGEYLVDKVAEKCHYGGFLVERPCHSKTGDEYGIAFYLKRKGRGLDYATLFFWFAMWTPYWEKSGKAICFGEG
ncbi:MAG: hypothetical protein ACLQMO_10910 [Acidobacteriaceae bacterium]